MTCPLYHILARLCVFLSYRGCVPKLGRTGRIEFGSGGVPPHVLLRGHFQVQISLSAQADKRPIQSNFLCSSPARPGAGEEQREGAAPSPDFNRQVLARNANLPPNWNAPDHVGYKRMMRPLLNRLLANRLSAGPIGSFDSGGPLS